MKRFPLFYLANYFVDKFKVRRPYKVVTLCVFDDF